MSETRKKPSEGEPCPYCGAKVVRAVPRQKARGHRAYYYEWYLRCSNVRCPKGYKDMPNEARRNWDE